MNTQPQLSQVIWANDTPIHVRPHPEHEYVVETARVANGYGVRPHTVRMHKREHADELFEGKHWISVSNPDADTRNGEPKKATFWTKRGIVRLGVFIKSERAKRFRDAAEDLVIYPHAALRAPIPDATLEERLRRMELHLANLAERLSDRPSPARLALSGPGSGSGRKVTTGRTHRSIGVSMTPEFERASKVRASALHLNWSSYVRDCIAFDLKYHLHEYKQIPSPSFNPATQQIPI